MKKLFLTAVLYVIITFAWAYLWNLVLWRETYVGLTGSLLRGEPIFYMGIAAMLVQSIALYYLFSRFFRGEKPVQESLLLVGLVAVFDIGYASLVVPAKFNITSHWTYAGLEAIYGTVHYTLVALALPFVFRNR